MRLLLRISRRAFWIVCRIFPIKENKIVFQTFYGRGYSDSPKYIAEKLRETGKDLDFVWVSNGREDPGVPEGFRVVRFRNFKYIYEMSTAKIWVDSCRKEYCIKKKNQYYMQTWHGGTRNEMYTMQPTNIQPVTRYFSQQDKIRIGSSRYHIDSVLGSKLGYTNTARYSYVCLAEQDGVRLICATMQSQLSTDKYNDMRTLLDYAFSTYKSYTQLPGGTVTAQLAVAGGGQSLGTVTVADPGVKLLLAEGLSAQDVTVDLELPEQYLLGAEPAVYAVYTLNGGAQQESTSVRVKAEITGLAELLEQSTGTKLEAARDVEPGSSAWLLAGISVGCTIGAAVVTVLVLRVHSRLKKRRKTARHHKKA